MGRRGAAGPQALMTAACLVPLPRATALTTSLPPGPATPQNPKDPDCRELLRAVDDALEARGRARMSASELPAAARAICEERDEGGPHWALHRVRSECVV